MPVSISYDVLPKWKEYERASTTIADAYLKPMVSRQLRHMRERFAQEGVTEHVVVIKSNGGEMTLEAAAERAGGDAWSPARPAAWSRANTSPACSA